MPTPPRTLRDAAGAQTDDEVRYLEQMGFARDWRDADPSDADDRQAIADYAKESLEAYRACADLRLSLSPEGRGGEPDGRWELLRDLERARGNVEPDAAPDPPLTVEYRRNVVSSPFRFEHGWVSVRFDDRLSLATVVSELRSAWPKLKAAGLPSRRALGDRKLALVRFVCLDGPPPSATWRDRLGAWNALYPSWPYAEARAMQSDFNRAERSLIGAGELRWFYDADYQATWKEGFARDFKNVVGELNPIVQRSKESLSKGGETNDTDKRT